MTNWLKIRELYEAGDLAVRQICEEHAVTINALYRRIDQEGWARRRAPKQRQQTKGKTAFKETSPVNCSPKNVSEEPSADKERATLIDRLYKAFEQQMCDFEAQRALVSDDGVNEKDARTLGSLARTLEKLIELKGEEEDTSGIQTKEVDIERLREKLARRLEKLRQQRGSE